LNLGEGDNLSTKDTTDEFILPSVRLLFGGFTVVHSYPCIKVTMAMPFANLLNVPKSYRRHTHCGLLEDPPPPTDLDCFIPTLHN